MPDPTDLLASQREPQRQRGDFTVLSCTSRSDGQYDLVLDDSLLYAEGGGQPADHGTVAGVAVVDVQKGPTGLRHLATAPVAPGTAEVVVDWGRRFDHMQQHTAQHLVTALAQDRLGLATVSFHLGEAVCTIDLDGTLTDRKRDQLAAWTNQAIREDHRVSQRVVTVEQYAALDLRSRGLPTGHSGPVRLIAIEDLDLNTCGGTHVERLGQLQLVHLLRTEAGKAGSRLTFIAGGRALERLDGTRHQQRALSDLLTCPPAEHVASVQRLQATLKAQLRASRQCEQELAGLLGAKLVAAEGVARLHREAGDMAFLQAVAQAAQKARPGARLVLTAGQQAGVFLVVGDPAWVAELGPRLAEAVGGRGGGRGGRYQGKGSNMTGRLKALGDG